MPAGTHSPRARRGPGGWGRAAGAAIASLALQPCLIIIDREVPPNPVVPSPCCCPCPYAPCRKLHSATAAGRPPWHRASAAMQPQVSWLLERQPMQEPARMEPTGGSWPRVPAACTSAARSPAQSRAASPTCRCVRLWGQGGGACGRHGRKCGRCARACVCGGGWRRGRARPCMHACVCARSYMRTCVPCKDGA